MNKIISIITRTPWWVWILLAFLLYRGIKALKSSIAPVYTLFILPTIFVGLSCQRLLSNTNALFITLPIWIGAILVGSFGGWLISKRAPIAADKKNRLIKRRGTKITLTLIVLIFGIRYYFGYSMAVNPELIQYLPFLITNLALSGLMSGIALGSSLCFFYKFKHAEHINLITQ